MNQKIALFIWSFFIATLSYGQSSVPGSFKSVTVGIDKKSRDKQALDNNMTKNIQQEQLLLELLVAGKFELYKYLDEKNEIHFFIGDNGSIEELYLVVFRNKEGKIQYFEQYKQQLKNAFGDCSKKSIIPYEYSEAAMVAAFKTYHLCIGQDDEEGKPRESNLTPIVSAAVLFANYNFHSKTTSFDQGLNDPTATSFVPSITLEHSAIGKRGVIYPQLQFALRRIKDLKSDNGIAQPIELQKRYEYVYDSKFLSVGVGIRYVMSKYQLARPYLRASVDLNIMASKSGTRTTITSPPGYIVTYIGADYGPEKHEIKFKMPFGFLAGAGISTKNYDIEVGLDRQMFFYKGSKGSSLSMTSPYASFSWRFFNKANKM
jgi:hypothetical protein